jgi:thiamine-monophosphate kinase
MAGWRRAGEFELIARHFAPLAAAEPGAIGLLDDAAVLALGRAGALVVTVDAMVAGVHFPPDDPPDLVARKLLRVSLSDLAAMGAQGRAYLLAAALPRGIDEDWVAAFCRGLATDQPIFGVTLVGGDTVATDGPLTLSLTAMGELGEGDALHRAGAREGDDIYVSGTIGDAALGLKALGGAYPDLAPEDRAFLIDRYRVPRPRVALGPRLAGLAHAAVDISDGLVADLGHVCAASRLGAAIEAARVPLSSAARAALGAEGAASPAVLSGGDDYELLFTAERAAAEALAALAVDLALMLTPIGRMTGGRGVTVLDPAGLAVKNMGAGGYRHF